MFYVGETSFNESIYINSKDKPSKFRMKLTIKTHSNKRGTNTLSDQLTTEVWYIFDGTEKIGEAYCDYTESVVSDHSWSVELGEENKEAYEIKNSEA